VRAEFAKARGRGQDCPDPQYADPAVLNGGAPWDVEAWAAVAKRNVGEERTMNLIQHFAMLAVQKKQARQQEEAKKSSGSYISSFFSMIMMGYAIHSLFGGGDDNMAPSEDSYS